MSDGQRRAALVLHALDGADRDWILAQLAEGERLELGCLLEELRELGIPSMKFELADVAAATPLDARARVRLADASAMAQVLATEPDAIVARMLSIEAWPWRDAMVARLPRRRRETIRRALHAAREERCGERLAHALVDGTDRRLAALRARPRLRERFARGARTYGASLWRVLRLRGTR